MIICCWLVKQHHPSSGCYYISESALYYGVIIYYYYIQRETRKAFWPDEVSIQVWKCLGDVGVKWLMDIFNKILSDNKMHIQVLDKHLISIYNNFLKKLSISNINGKAFYILFFLSPYIKSLRSGWFHNGLKGLIVN